MRIRSLIVLLFIGLLINADAIAKDALNFVQIVEGITQKRPSQTRQTIGRRYVWNFKKRPYTVLMTIDLERYNSYSGKERYDIPKLVEEGRTTLGNLTREFERTFKQNRGWTKQDRVDFILSFVQSLPYTFDDVTTGFDEFRRYAVETLIEGGGDCEDTTILVAAILRGLGERTALIFTPGHIALGVSGDFTGTSVTYDSTKYYYCETTGTGWTVGVMPVSIDITVESVIPLSPSKVGPAPKPDKTTPSPPVQPKPTPKVPEPTPKKPPIKPKPEEPKPETKKLKPEDKGTSESGNIVGGIIATLFFLIGLGVPIVYLVYRFVFADDNDDDWYDDGIDYDDTTESNNPLDW